MQVLEHLLSRLATCFLLLAGQASAQDIHGRVVGIADGDTLTIRVEGQPQMRVRLSAIDAPEKAHAFGQRAKQAQSDVCFGEDAALEVVDTDRYGRTVAEVWCGEVNANRAMIENGFAWVYRKYAEGRVDLMAAEVDARNARRGLWADQSPVPPWEFRRTKPPAR